MDGGAAVEREAERADPAASAAVSRRAVGVAGPPRLSWSELVGDDGARPLPRLLALLLDDAGTWAGPGLLEPASVAASLRARFAGAGAGSSTAAEAASTAAAARFELAGAVSALARDRFGAGAGTGAAAGAGAGGAGAAGSVLMDAGEAVSGAARAVRLTGDAVAASVAGRLAGAAAVREETAAGAGAGSNAERSACAGATAGGAKRGHAGSREGASDSSRLKRLAIKKAAPHIARACQPDPIAMRTKRGAPECRAVGRGQLARRQRRVQPDVVDDGNTPLDGGLVFLPGRTANARAATDGDGRRQRATGGNRGRRMRGDGRRQRAKNAGLGRSVFMGRLS